MEIELTDLKQRITRWPWLSLCLALLVVIALGALGSRYTPHDEQGYPQLLSPTEWQVILARHAYTAELDNLRREVELLTGQLQGSPDPVRSQITAERIEHSYRSGQPALEHQRSALIAAAQAVQDWAAGALPSEQAQQSVENAIQVLGYEPRP
jgi:hypothetical protein